MSATAETGGTDDESTLTDREVRRVVVVGQGYVGLPMSIRAVEAGYDVVGFDLDKSKISELAAGRSHIEDVSDEAVAAALESGRYRPTESEADLAGFDLAVISVPTPLSDGAPDISYIESAVNTIGRFLAPGATVVLESTTYPGTTDDVVLPLLEEVSGLTGGRDFHLGYSPERIDPGNAVWDFASTPKVVSGIDAASLAVISDFYQDLVVTVVPTRGTKEAELTKLLENTFRHVNIALVNELAIHAKGLGIDIWDVIRAADTKPFGFMRFLPGPGVGGHCLPVDPSYLSWQFERQLGSISRFVKIANDINNQMPVYISRRIQAGLNQRRKAVNGTSILVLGLAYKGGTGDARETPSTPLIRELLAMGAEVRAHDPHVADYELDDQITRVDLTAEELEAADVVVLVTDHQDFDLDLVAERADYIFDTRNVLVGDNVETL